MVAFHGKESIKQFYLDRVAKHRELDELVRGETGQGGRGCAVWCTLNKYDPAAYQTELGIPQALAMLEDGLFESMPLDLAMAWPESFLAAIKPGADLSLVLPRFFVWLLVDPEDGVIRYAKTALVRKAIQDVADLYSRKALGENVDAEVFRVVRKAAAAADAYSDAAYPYAAAACATYAAAACATYAAYSAADYAADAAYAAAADYAAAAKKQARIKQADKLIELLSAV